MLLINVDFLGLRLCLTLRQSMLLLYLLELESFGNVVNANGDLINEVKEGLSDANSFCLLC